MNITTTTDINSPPATVWTYLDDSEKIKQWMKGVEEDVPTSEGPTGVGSTFRMRIREGRQLADYDGEILVYDVNRHMRVRLVGGCMKEPMKMTVDYVLTPIDGDGTRLDYACTGEVGGVWRLLAPVMKPIVKLQLRGFMRRLKSLAEAEAPGASLPV